ncbi:hypothetical protein, partial [Phocaeicola sp.]|uniref:hypothetical protein n=1 Tax=Phocaeicola sp. TaxID=2773926 RepID=UPI002A8127DB
WRNFQLEYWRTFQLVSTPLTGDGCQVRVVFPYTHLFKRFSTKITSESVCHEGQACPVEVT